MWLGAAGREAGILRPGLWYELSESPALAGRWMGQSDPAHAPVKLAVILGSYNKLT